MSSRASLTSPLDRRTRRSALALVAAVVTLGAAACGSDSASTVAFSPEGELGRRVARTNGCAGCHGTEGQGQVGPALEGLYGSTVTFDDGSTAVADDAYLRESILEPSARKVEGFKLPMPETNLSDQEVDQLIAYIRDLGTSTTTSETRPPVAAP